MQNGGVEGSRLSVKWEMFHSVQTHSLVQNVFQVSLKQKVKTLSGITDLFDTRKVLRHGDTLSCMLFNFPWGK